VSIQIGGQHTVYSVNTIHSVCHISIVSKHRGQHTLCACHIKYINHGNHIGHLEKKEINNWNMITKSCELSRLCGQCEAKPTAASGVELLGGTEVRNWIDCLSHWYRNSSNALLQAHN